MKSIFSKEETGKLLSRINNLTQSSRPFWGNMTVSQMLAHCNVIYEMIYTDNYPKPNLFKRFLLKIFVKKAVVGEKPYTKNGRTAPQFIITDDRDFEKEKKQLISYLIKTQELGENYFNNKENHSFGRLTKEEWNRMFYKHLDHHLKQFGV